MCAGFRSYQTPFRAFLFRPFRVSVPADSWIALSWPGPPPSFASRLSAAAGSISLTSTHFSEVQGRHRVLPSPPLLASFSQASVPGAGPSPGARLLALAFVLLNRRRWQPPPPPFPILFPFPPPKCENSPSSLRLDPARDPSPPTRDPVFQSVSPVVQHATPRRTRWRFPYNEKQAFILAFPFSMGSISFFILFKSSPVSVAPYPVSV